MASQITDHAKTQRPANAKSSSGSSSNGNAPPASADSIAPQPKIAIHTPEADGLYFDSYESATEMVDPIFRDRINVKAIDDDILEVEHNRRHYVKLLVDALKYDDYMEAEEFRTTMTGVKKPCTASNVQAWDEWQEDTLTDVEGHMTMPNVEVRIEWIAWNIFKEIMKVHRTGFRYTSLAADSKSTCSQRVMLTVKAIKSTAVVRQRILEGCDLSDLAAGPFAYACSTARNRRNNSVRKTKAQVN